MLVFFLLVRRRPPRSTRTAPLFPAARRFRSRRGGRGAPPARRALPDAGRGGRRAALPHQARAALVVRSRADGLAVRPAARHPAAAVGGAAGLLPQARRLIERLLSPFRFRPAPGTIRPAPSAAGTGSWNSSPRRSRSASAGSA